MLPAILLRQLRQEFEPRPIGLRGHLGWTIGGGVEYAFTNNVSAKLEGLYVDLDDDTILAHGAVIGVTNTGAPVTYTGREVTRDNDFALVQVGLNYRFGTF